MKQLSLPLPLQILKRAADTFGYTWQVVDPFSQTLVKIGDGTKHFYANIAKVSMYPLNPAFAAQLVNDKAWTYQILQTQGYQIPKGDYFFLTDQYKEYRGEGKELADAFKWAEKLGFPVFVKPNNESCGVLAEPIRSPQELEDHLAKIKAINYIALVQEVIDLPEYRFFVVDGKVQFRYRRTSPTLIGDGVKSVRELLFQLNQRLPSQEHTVKEDSTYLALQLQDLGKSLDSVLEPGQQLRIAAKANISAGGKIVEYIEDIPAAVHEWAAQVANLFQLRVLGIDVFAPQTPNDPESFIMIEINSNPGLAGIYQAGHHQKALEIWQKILNQYFAA